MGPADETPAQITGFYHWVWEHSDATIGQLDLDSPGSVPWWPEEHRPVTLHRVLVHMAAETDRHVGHADIVRELIDGSVGFRASNRNMVPGDQAWWGAYRQRLQDVALQAQKATT